MRPADFFDDDYRRVLEPFHPEAEARHETAALREMLGLSQDDRVLDLACGWGRHLRLLGEAGHDVTGVDLSLPLLRNVETGPPYPRHHRPAARLAAGDMLLLPFRDGSFDVVLNLATSLGIFLDDEPAVRALREARRVLRPQGRVLIESMHREDVLAGYAERDRWALADGTEVRVRRRLDASQWVSHEVLRWRGPEGSGTKRHSLRLRSVRELTELLEEAGLVTEATYGGWDREEIAPRSERLIVLARRG